MPKSPAAWMLLSTALFATMSALVKMASADISIAALLVFRNLPSAIALLLFAKVCRLPIATPQGRLHAMRCLVGLSGMILGFYAIKHLPLATATTLEYTAPLFLVLAHVLLRRRLPRAMEFAAIAVGFAGVVLLLQPTLNADQTVPFLVGLASGGCAAMAYRCVFRLGQAGEPGWRIVLVYSIVGSLCGMLALPFAPSSNFTPVSMAALAGVGVLGLGGQLTMTQAFRTGATSMLATLQYTTVIFSVCYGVIFWGDKPTPMAISGLVLIVGSGMAAARSIAMGHTKPPVRGSANPS